MVISYKKLCQRFVLVYNVMLGTSAVVGHIASGDLPSIVETFDQWQTECNNRFNQLKANEKKIHHLADQMISIDLDDGVKKNYAIFQDVLK